MEQLWDRPDGLSVREVLDGLDSGLAYTTVMTVLDRLAKKGVVSRERDGRAWRYRPSASRGEQTAQVLRDALGGLSATGRRDAMLHFLGDSSPDELADLRAALAQLEQNQTP
ncbi:BlaI/MecI/CopY family transcriptional regulator [Leekyejoonella antrihumi]|uniref:BlaI/MecI/CopY family transcriptional regulator n=2 Tax=Leekyejoonella antrihumi TaxID=1660198 RepID=A0A563E663_9MICO|nr:BlaI/MecI/CopY family transcriptional regulator [Leekyejoonella antrihumi]